MRPLVLIALMLTATVARGQYLGFITRVGIEVDAPVRFPDGAPPTPDCAAQLFRVMEDGSITPLLPATTFQTDAADARQRFYVRPVNMLVPGIVFQDAFADPVEITVFMRAWQGADWETARVKGQSEPVRVLIRNLLFPPANLDGLQGFVLDSQPRIARMRVADDAEVELALSGPGTESAVVVEFSSDLKNWTGMGEYSVLQGVVALGRMPLDKPIFFRVRAEALTP